MNDVDYAWVENTVNIKGVFHASPDWSQFDNHIYEELIVVAFSLLEQCWDESEGFQHNYNQFVLESIIDKHVVLDSGHIYCLRKGLPSGHPLTSVINSLIN